MIEVQVAGIRLEMPSNQPVLILRDPQTGRYLPLWIGASEATAISIALEGVAAPRPLTHDLMVGLIDHLEDALESVSVSDLSDGVFYAQLNLRDHEPLSARPSDAVALAVRCAVPVYVSPDVMAAAGMEAGPNDDQDGVDEQEEVERFRAFLDEINPEDF
jgi:bifunctional DNase/RNase